MWAAAIPLIMSMIQSVSQKNKEKKQLPIEVAKARYSPWLGMEPSYGQADTGKTMATGGLAAAQMYQNQQQQDNFNKWLALQDSNNFKTNGRFITGPNNYSYAQQGPMLENETFTR